MAHKVLTEHVFFKVQIVNVFERDSCEFVAVCFGRSSMHDLGNCTVRSFETSCGERKNSLKFGVLALLKPLP